MSSEQELVTDQINPMKPITVKCGIRQQRTVNQLNLQRKEVIDWLVGFHQQITNHKHRTHTQATHEWNPDCNIPL